ncbi:MAG: family 20 glycosylhydrolase [Muribaculaceae bacterium]|nr:family 20 glycosylhydrolase [Muribaculaceae bacterium]
MKLKKFIIGTLIIAGGSIISAENIITWETLGNELDSEGNDYHIERYTILADEPYDGVAFCQTKTATRPVDPADTLIEILPGYYLIKSPKFLTAVPNDSVVIDLWKNKSFRFHLFLPDGMHLVKDGKPIPAKVVRKRLTSFPEQWVNPKNGDDFMTYGDEAYLINDSLKSSYRSTPYNQIPTLKSIALQENKVDSKELVISPINIEQIEDDRTDYWQASIKDGKITIKTNSEYPEIIAESLKRRIKESADENGLVPEVEIEDWSDFPYRGFMLDVARNFLPKEDVKVVIDQMSKYGLNILHFHLGEDEAWRMEIPSLPELTQVGGHRGYTLTDDVPFLKGIYSGDGNPDSHTVANGFYNVNDFIEILKYADSKGVKVIPEFDTPGHSRAAIRSMEWRAKHNGDDSYRLIEDGDTSKYRTAQDFYDNLMNPALEGPYKFWDTVFDDVIAIYNKAGVPLLAINVGGDEVPKNAWDGSAAVHKLMKEKGLTSQNELHAYFVERLAKIAKEKGIKIAGWQEVALNHSTEYDSVVAPVTYGVNSWTKGGKENSKKMAEKGYNVILSNVDYLYFDHHYSGHPEEPGMWWGGILTEFTPLNATIDTLMPADSLTQSKIIGISAHLFGETIRDFGMVKRYVFPRILGLAERAHNSHSTLTEKEYFGIITEEMPTWDEEGINFFVRQPGIIEEEGIIFMNEPYGLGEIRYTIDGSEPDRSSEMYQQPLKVEDYKEIRAKHFIGNSESSTSILYKTK